MQKGETGRNPKGNNQYTYREDTEKEFAALCKKRIRKVLSQLFDEAEAGSQPDRKLVLERAMPAVKEFAIDHRVDARSPEFVPTEADHEELQKAGTSEEILH